MLKSHLVDCLDVIARDVTLVANLVGEPEHKLDDVLTGVRNLLVLEPRLGVDGIALGHRVGDRVRGVLVVVDATVTGPAGAELKRTEQVDHSVGVIESLKFLS